MDDDNLSYYALEIGKIYDTALPRQYEWYLFNNPPNSSTGLTTVGTLLPKETFMVLDLYHHKSLVQCLKILTSDGQLGWLSTDNGRRFKRISE